MLHLFFQVSEDRLHVIIGDRPLLHALSQEDYPAPLDRGAPVYVGGLIQDAGCSSGAGKDTASEGSLFDVGSPLLLPDAASASAAEVELSPPLLDVIKIGFVGADVRPQSEGWVGAAAELKEARLPVVHVSPGCGHVGGLQGASLGAAPELEEPRLPEERLVVQGIQVTGGGQERKGVPPVVHV